MLRLAKEEDLLQIEQIYHEILDLEASSISYTNWQKGLYPTIHNAREALLAGTLFVGEDNKSLYGSVILNHIHPRNIAKLIGKHQQNQRE